MKAVSAVPLPRPRARPRPRKAPWGWLEVVGLAQYVLPAMLFVPFIVGPLRTASRVAGFAVALLALLVILASGRRGVGRPFPAATWLAVMAAWLLLSIFHPESNSLLAAAAEAGLVIAVFSPGLWVGRLSVTPQRLGRLLLMIFLVCAASTSVGILQYYYPGRFDPPNMRYAEVLDEEVFASLFYETPDGRRVLRPCGLSDTPGAAASAGAITFLLGVGLALRPGSRWWWRLSCLLLAVSGMAIMYFSQVRQMLITTVLAAGLMVGLFALRGEIRRALTIAAVGGGLFGLALLWALRSGGEAVLARFRALFERGDLMETYYASRGHFIESALFHWLPKYPVGAGLGRWGMANVYFGQRRPAGFPGGNLYAEDNITAWVYQGGIVMLVLAGGALLVTMIRLVRIARTTPDRDLANSAAVITALCAGILTQVFGSPPFVAPTGLIFWLLAAALHAADQNVRVEQRRARPLAAAPPPSPPPSRAAPPPRFGAPAR